MASGYYPLDASTDDGGKAIAVISNSLRKLLNERGEGSQLPDILDNDQTDNAASDAAYETYLWLAVDLMERCITRRKS